MPTMTEYTFTKEIDHTDVLADSIQQSAISTALDHIDTVGDGPTMEISIYFKDALSGADQTTLSSLVQNYQDSEPAPNNQPIIPVMTQYETNDKDLKLAKAMQVVNPSTYKAVMSLKIPGTFGSSDGRYVAGGYAISEDYNKDDYVTVRVEDTDRLIALAVAQSQNPSATQPVDDATMQQMGVIPGSGAFPEYPIVKSYTDDELDIANEGWYFWPLAIGNNTAPAGECEVEPIGGYGFIPAGMYIVLEYVRPNGVTTGSCRINLYWGKKE